MQFVIPVVQIALILFKALELTSLTWFQVFIPTIVWLVVLPIDAFLVAKDKL